MTDYSNLPDQDLVTFMKKGDHAAFAMLYDRYKGVLYIHIKRMLANQHETKDIIQEVFTTLWIKRENLVFTGSIKSYLYSAVRNRVFNLLAHRKFETNYLNSLEELITNGQFTIDEELQAKQLIKLIEDEVQHLPKKMKEVFELSRNLHLTHREIAEQLNISDKTVKKQINNALHILRPKINLILAVFPFF